LPIGAIEVDAHVSSPVILKNNVADATSMSSVMVADIGIGERSIAVIIGVWIIIGGFVSNAVLAV